MPTFILTIILLGSNGLPLPVQPAPYPYEGIDAAKLCTDAMIATYAAPMGKYRLVSAKCLKDKK